MVYFGEATFVHCAEEERRFQECNDLRICVESGSTHMRTVQGSFPSEHIVIGSSLLDVRNEVLTVS